VTGVPHPVAIAAFGLAASVGVATISEMTRGVRAQRRAFGGGVWRSTVAAFSRNRRLYGGLVAHLGLVLAIVAITWSSSYRAEQEVTLARGQSTTFAGYDLRFVDADFRNEPQRIVYVSTLEVSRDGRTEGVLIPSLNYYPSAPNDPIGTPSISKGTPLNGFHDLYASLQTLAPKGTSATFRLFSNPGVMWLWVGGAVMVIGGAIALWPPRKRRGGGGAAPVVREAEPAAEPARVEAEVTA
jgi:cytochrome c-type biogenesis protein CcmF